MHGGGRSVLKKESRFDFLCVSVTLDAPVAEGLAKHASLLALKWKKNTQIQSLPSHLLSLKKHESVLLSLPSDQAGVRAKRPVAKVFSVSTVHCPAITTYAHFRYVSFSRCQRCRYWIEIEEHYCLRYLFYFPFRSGSASSAFLFLDWTNLFRLWPCPFLPPYSAKHATVKMHTFSKKRARERTDRAAIGSKRIFANFLSKSRKIRRAN